MGGEDISIGDERRKLSKNRIPGTVKFFHPNGYGFIETSKPINWPWKMPTGSDVYVSREELNIDEDCPFNIRTGMEVEFNVFVQEGKDTLAAANVTAPGGEPLEGCRLKKKIKGKGKGKGKDGKGKGKGKDNGKGKCKGSGKSASTTKITPIKKTIFKVK